MKTDLADPNAYDALRLIFGNLVRMLNLPDDPLTVDIAQWVERFAPDNEVWAALSTVVFLSYHQLDDKGFPAHSDIAVQADDGPVLEPVHLALFKELLARIAKISREKYIYEVSGSRLM